MLDSLTIILFRPKFPENVGGVARACANLGCSALSLVAPRNWDPEKAKPMATPQGEPIDNVGIVPQVGVVNGEGEDGADSQLATGIDIARSLIPAA